MPRTSKPFPRYMAARLREALADTPAVLIHGPRQSGKTTLARLVGEPRGYRYVSFDDEAIRGAARRDPIGFVDGLPPRRQRCTITGRSVQPSTARSRSSRPSMRWSTSKAAAREKIVVVVRSTDARALVLIELTR